MSFPVFIHIGPFSIHPHFLFETLAYIIGFRIFVWSRKKSGDILTPKSRLTIMAASIFGALLGSKMLYWLCDPVTTLKNLHNFNYMMGGKTIAGGLAGGLFLVEFVKKILGIKQATGDLFAIPLALGIAIGRIGCFLSGLEDHTYGNATNLPWGVDFGDGVLRHPVQIYEIIFLIGLIGMLRRFSKHPHRQGDIFKIFMIFYFAFRLGVEFLKPGVLFGGLSAIQWTSIVLLFYYSQDMIRFLNSNPRKSHGASR